MKNIGGKKAHGTCFSDALKGGVAESHLSCPVALSLPEGWGFFQMTGWEEGIAATQYCTIC